MFDTGNNPGAGIPRGVEQVQRFELAPNGTPIVRATDRRRITPPGG
jgi:hypothetical protein